MQKKVIITCLSLIVMLSLVTLYFFNVTSNKNIVDLETIDNSTFLNDKLAVTYYSTTIDSEKSKGFIIFIDDQGDTTTVETDGLELGRLGYNGKSLFFQDQINNYTLSDELTIDDRSDYQHTGDYVGTREDETFFSIFNSGMGMGDDTYRSDIYWYDHQQLTKDVLPFYIESRGHTENLIYTLHREDLESNEFILSQTELSDHARMTQMMTWEPDQEVLPVSNLHVKNNHLYYIGESHQQNESFFQLVEWDLTNEKVTDHLVAGPMTSEEHYESIPYDSQKSAYLYNDTFYFIDGVGRVYTTDLHSGITKESFMIEETTRDGDFVQIDWKDDNLYVFYYHIDGERSTGLDTYNIETGQKINTLDIHGIEDIIEHNKGLFSYDLIILD